MNRLNPHFFLLFFPSPLAHPGIGFLLQFIHLFFLLSLFCHFFLFNLYHSFTLPVPSLRLLSAVLRTSEVESRATRASLTELLSPQMGKDIVWFLKRWAKTYLLVDEKLYEQVQLTPDTTV